MTPLSLLAIICMLLLIITALIIAFVMLRYSRKNRKVHIAIPISLVAFSVILAIWLILRLLLA